jgi:tetratricopeptide (TPR) repeat protein
MLVENTPLKTAEKTADKTIEKKQRVSSRGSADRMFQGALFSYHRGDYASAGRDFETAAQAFSYLGDHAQYVESCYYLLRILAERDDFDSIAKIERQLSKVLERESITAKLRSRAIFAMGVCACYKNDGHVLAMRLFRESIDFAMSASDKEALASPLYGCATVLYAQKKYEEALRELNRLDELLSCLGLPDVSSASKILRSMIYRNTGHVDDALEAAWSAYETLKEVPHFVLFLHALTLLGSLYILKGDISCARLYLELAERSLKRSEFPRLASLVDEAMAQVRKSRIDDFDLTFDSRTGVLIERNKGEIRFEGQFILRDLLRVFMENPGVVFTKENLTRMVWRETYASDVHDNKIYVTIKRLRKLLEFIPVPSPSRKPGKSVKQLDYIMRAKTGYFLNPKVKIRIDKQELTPVTANLDPVREECPT